MIGFNGPRQTGIKNLLTQPVPRSFWHQDSEGRYILCISFRYELGITSFPRMLVLFPLKSYNADFRILRTIWTLNSYFIKRNPNKSPCHIHSEATKRLSLSGMAPCPESFPTPTYVCQHFWLCEDFEPFPFRLACRRNCTCLFCKPDLAVKQIISPRFFQGIHIRPAYTWWQDRPTVPNLVRSQGFEGTPHGLRPPTKALPTSSRASLYAHDKKRYEHWTG